MSALRGEMRKEFAQWPLTEPQWGVLHVLGEAGADGLTMSELSERLLVTCGNTTGLIDRLYRAGYVRRRPHPEDRRAISVTLTDRGREVCLRGAETFRRRLAELLACLTDEQRGLLVGLLTQIANHVAGLRTTHMQ